MDTELEEKQLKTTNAELLKQLKYYLGADNIDPISILAGADMCNCCKCGICKCTEKHHRTSAVQKNPKNTMKNQQDLKKQAQSSGSRPKKLNKQSSKAGSASNTESSSNVSDKEVDTITGVTSNISDNEVEPITGVTAASARETSDQVTKENKTIPMNTSIKDDESAKIKDKQEDIEPEVSDEKIPVQTVKPLQASNIKKKKEANNEVGSGNLDAVQEPSTINDLNTLEDMKHKAEEINMIEEAQIHVKHVTPLQEDEEEKEQGSQAEEDEKHNSKINHSADKSDLSHKDPLQGSDSKMQPNEDNKDKLPETKSLGDGSVQSTQEVLPVMGPPTLDSSKENVSKKPDLDGPEKEGGLDGPEKDEGKQESISPHDLSDEEKKNKIQDDKDTKSSSTKSRSSRDSDDTEPSQIGQKLIEDKHQPSNLEQSSNLEPLPTVQTDEDIEPLGESGSHDVEENKESKSIKNEPDDHSHPHFKPVPMDEIIRPLGERGTLEAEENEEPISIKPDECPPCKFKQEPIDENTESVDESVTTEELSMMSEYECPCFESKKHGSIQNAFILPTKSTSLSSFKNDKAKLIMFHRPKMEKTVLIVKPEAVKFKDVILRAIRKEGLDLIDEKLIYLSPEQVAEIYTENYGSAYFPLFVQQLSSSPILVLSVSGMNAVDRWRNLVGGDENIPKSWFYPESMKRRFGLHEDVLDAMRYSEDYENARTETRYFFPLQILDPIMIDSLEVQDYCDKYIHPTLLKGIDALLQEKPSDPLLFFAEWLLKNNPYQPFYNKINVTLSPL